MKIYAIICHKLDLTQFWPKVVSWRFEIATDEIAEDSHTIEFKRLIRYGTLEIKPQTIALCHGFLQILIL